MNLEIVDVHTIEKELQRQMTNFSDISKKIQLNGPIKILFEEMNAIINAYHNIIFQLKFSYRINSYSPYEYGTKVLLLSNFTTNTFNNIQILSEKLHVPVHMLINELMENFLKNTTTRNKIDSIKDLSYQSMKMRLIKSKNEITLSKKDFIEVMKSDLSEVDVIYNFRDIEILIFKNISVNEFQDNIGMISHCDTVFLPNNIPKLLIYSKMKQVKTIKTYKSLNDVYDAIFIFN